MNWSVSVYWAEWHLKKKRITCVHILVILLTHMDSEHGLSYSLPPLHVLYMLELYMLELQKVEFSSGALPSLVLDFFSSQIRQYSLEEHTCTLNMVYSTPFFLSMSWICMNQSCFPSCLSISISCRANFNATSNSYGNGP